MNVGELNIGLRLQADMNDVVLTITSFKDAIGGDIQRDGDSTRAAVENPAASQRQTDQGTVVDLIIEAAAADVKSGGKVVSAFAASYPLVSADGAARC